jgi:hypothetical protein
MHVSARPMGMTAISAGSIQKILVEAAEVERCRLSTMPQGSFEWMRPILADCGTESASVQSRVGPASI